MQGKTRFAPICGVLRMVCVLTAAAVSLSAVAADSVEWPADFDAALSAKIEAMKPSGSQRGEGSAVSWFDSVMCVEGYASIAVLRNFPKPGFILTFR